jgi:hypothetical protein
MPWITTESGYVYRYLGNDLYNDYDDLGWVRYELHDAMDISNGLDGQVWILNAYGEVIKIRESLERIRLADAKQAANDDWGGERNASNPIKRTEQFNPV